MPIDFKEVRAATGLSQAAFAATYRLPLRTVQDWEGKSHKGFTPATETLLGMIRADHELAALLVRKAFPLD